MFSEIREDLLDRSPLVGNATKSALPPALVVLSVAELKDFRKSLLNPVQLVLVDIDGAMFRCKLQERGGDACLLSLARLTLAKATGIHLEDNQVVNGDVGESVGVLSHWSRGGGEIGAEPVWDHLDLNLLTSGQLDVDEAGLLKKGAHWVVDNLLLDPAGRRRLADDKVDALTILVRRLASLGLMVRG